MKWFKRHINWTLIVVAVGTYLLTMVTSAPVETTEQGRSVLGLLIQSVNPSISNETLGWFYLPIWLALMLPVAGWVLKQKGRSLWHLLWGIVPLGWIVILCLKNQNIMQDKSIQNSESKIVLPKDSKTALLKDKDWSQIDGDACRVTDFTPLGSVVDIDGKVRAMDMTTPYASITIECQKLGKNITGYITHKIDFRHLWAAFKERTAREDEEVIIIWTTKNYKRFIVASPMMPKLLVWVCPKGAFELMTDNIYNPELSSEAWHRAIKPIVEWKPEVMD